MFFLQAVVEQLVHLGDAGGDGEVDGAVADFDDEPADDVGVDLVGDLELLARADVGRLGDGGLEAGEGLAVEVLFLLNHHYCQSQLFRMALGLPVLSRGE